MFSARTVAWLLAILIGVLAWVYIIKSSSPVAPPVAEGAPANSAPQAR